MGYAESSYDLDHLYAKFLTLADKKGQVFDYDLEALAFFSQIHEEPEHFKLEYLGVQSGSSVLATASVKLKVGGEVVSEAATGNGPVDAVYQCINRITGYEIRIDKYALKSKGEGKMPSVRSISSPSTKGANSTAWGSPPTLSNPQPMPCCM